VVNSSPHSWWKIAQKEIPGLGWPPGHGPDVQPAIRAISGTRPGKHTKNYGKSPFSMGKSTINGHFQ